MSAPTCAARAVRAELSKLMKCSRSRASRIAAARKPKLGRTLRAALHIAICGDPIPISTLSISLRGSLVAGVHPKVHPECAGRREGLAACVARVGLVAGVHPKVHRELAL